MYIFITLTININNKTMFEGVFNIYLFCFVFNNLTVFARILRESLVRDGENLYSLFFKI